jgi:general secretion pathway protein G
MQRLRKHSLPTTGMTLLELMLATLILLILASAAMPLARLTIKREREAELRRDLREMHDAIDRYKDAADRGLIRVEQGTEGYPPDLETLVNGVQVGANQVGAAGGGLNPAGSSSSSSSTTFSSSGSNSSSSSSSGSSSNNGGANGSGSAQAQQKVRFLRKIPVDPMTGRAEWGLRAVQDDPTSSTWGGKNVFDVYSLSSGTAMDGTKYADW